MPIFEEDMFRLSSFLRVLYPSTTNVSSTSSTSTNAGNVKRGSSDVPAVTTQHAAPGLFYRRVHPSLSSTTMRHSKKDMTDNNKVAEDSVEQNGPDGDGVKQHCRGAKLNKPSTETILPPCMFWRRYRS